MPETRENGTQIKLQWIRTKYTDLSKPDMMVLNPSLDLLKEMLWHSIYLLIILYTISSYLTKSFGISVCFISSKNEDLVTHKYRGVCSGEAGLRVNETQGTRPTLFLSSSSSPSNFSSRDKPYVWISLYLMRLHSLKLSSSKKRSITYIFHMTWLGISQGLSCDGSPWVLKFQNCDLLPPPSPSELRLCHVLGLTWLCHILGLPWYLRW